VAKRSRGESGEKKGRRGCKNRPKTVEQSKKRQQPEERDNAAQAPKEEANGKFQKKWSKTAITMPHGEKRDPEQGWTKLGGVSGGKRGNQMVY